MGTDTYKKFMRTKDRWTVKTKTQSPPPRYATRYATAKAAVEGGVAEDGDDSDGDDEPGLFNIDVSVRAMVVCTRPPVPSLPRRHTPRQDLKGLVSAAQLTSVLDALVDNAVEHGDSESEEFARKIAVLGEVRVPCPAPPCTTPKSRAHPVVR